MYDKMYYKTAHVPCPTVTGYGRLHHALLCFIRLRSALHSPCTQVMFLGMSLCLPLAYWQQWKAKKLREAGRLDEPLLGADVVRLSQQTKCSVCM